MTATFFALAELRNPLALLKQPRSGDASSRAQRLRNLFCDTDLKAGKRYFDLYCWRDNHETQWQVLRGEADIVAQRSSATGAEL